MTADRKDKAKLNTVDAAERVATATLRLTVVNSSKFVRDRKRATTS